VDLCPVVDCARAALLVKFGFEGEVGQESDAAGMGQGEEAVTESEVIAQRLRHVRGGGMRRMRLVR
jgi:hypothetical protein